MMFHVDFKLNSQNYTRVEGNQTKPVCYIMTHEEEKKQAWLVQHGTTKPLWWRKGVLRRHPHGLVF